MRYDAKGGMSLIVEKDDKGMHTATFLHGGETVGFIPSMSREMMYRTLKRIENLVFAALLDVKEMGEPGTKVAKKAYPVP